MAEEGLDVDALIPTDITMGSFDFACGISYATFEDSSLSDRKIPIILAARLLADSIYIAKNRLMIVDDNELILGIYLGNNKIQSIANSLRTDSTIEFPGFTEEHKKTLINMHYKIASEEQIIKCLPNYQIV